MRKLSSNPCRVVLAQAYLIFKRNSKILFWINYLDVFYNTKYIDTDFFLFISLFIFWLNIICLKLMYGIIANIGSFWKYINCMYYLLWRNSVSSLVLFFPLRVFPLSVIWIVFMSIQLVNFMRFGKVSLLFPFKFNVGFLVYGHLKWIFFILFLSYMYSYPPKKIKSNAWLDHIIFTIWIVVDIDLNSISYC